MCGSTVDRVLQQSPRDIPHWVKGFPPAHLYKLGEEPGISAKGKVLQVGPKQKGGRAGGWCALEA